jgi:flagellar biogenesis protein FliO
MNVRTNRGRLLGSLAMILWLVGGAAYYVVRFSQSFYTENEVQIRQAVASLFGE